MIQNHNKNLANIFLKFNIKISDNIENNNHGTNEDEQKQVERDCS